VPGIGRFLSVDPVERGSCNDYDYVCGDPVNGRDLGGTKNRGLTLEEAKQVAHIAGDCLYGPDPGFSSSSFCTGFLRALAKNDLTDYGFGFEPNHPTYSYAAIKGYVIACAQNAATGALIGSVEGAWVGAGVGALQGCATGAVLQLAKNQGAPEKYVDGGNDVYDLYNLHKAIAAFEDAASHA
jgi:hypothetical protein